MFKETFKYFKTRREEISLDQVYDLNAKETNFNDLQIEQEKLTNNRNHFTFSQPELWEVYKFSGKPGLTYIKNPFTPLGQRYWTVRCLRDYSKKCNKRNIDPFNVVPEGKEWWDVAQCDRIILNKLRWATLGYHHNWDTKIYTEDNRGILPEDLSAVTKVIAHNLGYSNYTPQAAIINYYHMDSTLSGHTDHSEVNLSAPLFSFSFGQTAIFLLGGRTLEEEPLAIFLRSGDIVVMSEESRLCYHGVPKILKTSEKKWNNVEESKNLDRNEIFEVCTSASLWKPYGDYLENCRINMNVRQVLYKSQQSLNDKSVI